MSYVPETHLLGPMQNLYRLIAQETERAPAKGDILVRV